MEVPVLIKTDMKYISECGYPSKQLGSQAFGLEFRSPEPRYREPQSKLAREFD